MRPQSLDSTLEFEKKLKTNTSASLGAGGHTGSLSSANSRSASQKKDVLEYWQICVSKVLKARDTKAKAYELRLASLDQQAKHLSEQLQRVTSSKALTESHAAQISADSSKKKQQLEANSKQAELLKEKEVYDAKMQFQLEKQHLDDLLNKANSAATAATNDLKNFEKEAPLKGATKVKGDVTAAQATYASLGCSTVCAEAGKSYKDRCEVLSKKTPQIKDEETESPTAK